MIAFKENLYPSIGVEQEFQLIDPTTADLVPLADNVCAQLPDNIRDSACHELFYSVIEARSPVCKSPAELERELRAQREVYDQAARRVGARVVAAASHPFARWQDQRVIDSDHYRWVAEQCVCLAQRLLAFGLHIHVGVRTGDAAVYCMNELRRWLYPLFALSVNSPFFEGEVTGLASTRAHLFDSMPRTNLPPEVSSMDELLAHYDLMRAAGDVSAPGDLWWSIRPQPPLGTLELRLLDLPTDVRRVTALTAVVQSLVATFQDAFFDSFPSTKLYRECLEENYWKAMRFGLEADIIDPCTREVLSMRDQVGRMCELAQPKARELGVDKELSLVDTLLLSGTESEAQLARYVELEKDLTALHLELADRTIA